MTHTNLFESLGWRRSSESRSLEEVHKSIPIPKTFSFWRKLFAFAGPGFLVAVGYMDPGNWATDLAGGSQFGYTLLSVIFISNLMAMLLQHLSIKLGIVFTKVALKILDHRGEFRLQEFIRNLDGRCFANRIEEQPFTAVFDEMCFLRRKTLVHFGAECFRRHGAAEFFL
jgi:hypothetical protein